MTRKTTEDHEASIDLALGLDLDQSLGLSLGLDQNQKYLKKEIFPFRFFFHQRWKNDRKDYKENFFFQIFLVLV